MPELTYNLASGVNQDNLLNLRLDTQERMRDLYEGFNVPKYQPPQSFIPKHFDTDAIVGGDVALPTLREALYSKDPAVARAAAEQARYIASKDPTATGLGMQNKVKYQEGQDKFTDNHWWKENNQTMYGFNPYKSVAENEDFLHKQLWDNYSFGGKLWRGVGTFAGRTLSKLVTGLVGAVGDVGSMAWNGLQEAGDLITNPNEKDRNNFWEDVSNNWLSRKMTEVDDYVKTSILPVYKALDYDNKGAWAKLFDATTWQTSFADGAGFLLQFAVPGALLGRAAQAGKLARSIGEFSTLEELATVAPQTAQKIAKAGFTIEEAKNVSGFTRLMGLEIGDATKAQRAFGNTAEFLTGSKNVGGISAHIFNTTLESVAETKQGFDDTVKDLMGKGMSRDQAVKIASENAPGQFWVNMGILSVSNAFENKLLQKAVGNRAASIISRVDDGTLPAQKEAATRLAKFFNNNKWGNRIKYYGQNSIKASFFEGYWEENAQTAAQRWARGEYTRQGDDTKTGKKEVTEKGLSGFFKQLYKQTIDSAKGNDREAADSIMAGAVIGVIGMNAFAKISGERKQQVADKANLIANFRNTRDAWLALNTLSADIYDKDGKIIPEKAKEKADEIAEKLDKIDSVFKRTVTGESLVDPQQREATQYRVFADYVKAHIMNGTQDALIERLSQWSEKAPGELAMYGVTPELQQDAHKWATLGQELIDKWNEIKDIKYSAPKTETVQSYFTKSEALKSLVFDYTALKSMSETLASKYQDLKDEVNPFSQFPMQQPYNEKQAEIIALKHTLENEEVPAEKEQIQAKIDKLEEEQKTTRKSIFDLGETKEDGTGFLIPKKTDPQANPIDFNDVVKFLNYQFHQSDHENAVKTHTKLIEDYSNPQNGVENYNKVVDYWAKEAEKIQQDDQDQIDTKVAKDTIDSLNKQYDDLAEQAKNAKTEEERKGFEAQMDEVTTKIKDILDAVDKDIDDVVDKDLDTVNDDVTKTPTEPQLAHDSITSDALAWETPFKTANKETRNIVLDNGDILYWKENVLEHSYDHDLTQFIKTFSKEMSETPGKYEVFIIKDTEELLEQRLSEKQLELWKAGGNELGAIVVFKEKGKAGWVKFEERKGTPIVAFSYNKTAFEDQKDVRAFIRANKTGVDIPTVLKFYEEQQSVADLIRVAVVANPNLQVPVETTIGSFGVFPTTLNLENAFQRFNGFHDGVIKIVKNVNDFTGDVSLGQTLLEIPKDKTDSKLPFYIPLTTGHLIENDTPIGIRIRQAVQAINFAKFDTAEEASFITQNFLKKLFYTDTHQYFRVNKDGNKFKIAYYRKNPKTGEEVNAKSYTNLKLKLLESLYDGSKKLAIYEKDPQTGKFAPSEIEMEQYREFIHASLNTDRKVLIIKKGKAEKIYTQKVNGYLNLTKIGEGVTEAGEEKTTTEEVLAQPMAPPDVVARQRVHQEAKDASINIDTDEFKAKSKELTGKEHLDDMNIEELNKMLAFIGEKEPEKEIPKDLDDLIRRKKDAINSAKEAVRIGVENANTPNIKEIIEKQGTKAIEKLQKELSDLEALIPKEEEPSPLNELRTEVALNQPMPDASAITTVKVNRKEFRIDFENTTFLSASTITPTDIERLGEFFEKAHAYTYKALNINGKSVYLVKYNKIGKFVILDENYKIIPENKELLANEEYKKFKNCE